MDKTEVSERVAHQAFNCLGYVPTPQRLEYSAISVAWKMGLQQQPSIERPVNDNPWAAVTIHYHYQEALVVRFWAMQAEILFGYLSKIMRMTEEELSVPVRASGIVPLDVLRAMTQWSLTRAVQRARIVGSPGEISAEDATAIFNSQVLRYEALVNASVQDTRPIPVKDFQLGLSREHPWTELLCYGADNPCEGLIIENQMRPLTEILMQLALSQIQNGLYSSLQALP